MARGRRPVRICLSLLIAATALFSMAGLAGAATRTASLRLLSPQTSITLYRYGDEPVWLDIPALVAASGAAWEVRAHRESYRTPIGLWQQYADGTSRRLPSDLVDDFNGLDRFFSMSMRNADGERVFSRTRSFCPEGEDMRVSAAGPMASRYPRFCGFEGSAAAFTRGAVWGIEKGWAVPALGWNSPTFRGPDGLYTVRMSITRRYRELFGISPDHARVVVSLRITTDDGCFDCPGSHPHGPNAAAPGAIDGHHHHGTAAAGRVRGPLGFAPSLATPPASALPDLIALPAFSITLDQRRGQERIEFGANVWNAGPSPMLVEGFRRENQDVMEAYQYFLRGDRVMGRARVGAMEFHDKPGHHHWHFLQFARYSLWNAERDKVVVAKKQAFCLAPTDAIDLTVPGADWQPYETGLGTACGGPEAVWIRETLQAGWGDTYYQVAGQSLDISGVPNGTYYVAVEANPMGLLYERDYTNNIELRRIELGGTPGDRTLQVFPWHSIDA